ncbi:DUF1987 domain-containing protein [Glaciimonas sp. PCH181]|uniref:DUF1987 domain-containing protein n=1 Tax=Glaciimonas sp. PCH181 TaxID=2133943 RepID=UPI000D398839|nr:DUF1987 domain-containing protein [Glaciimonas sp. PCH181]PUA17787.1 Fe-S oxidoreductase [Glaciimonas sp. PCH181]
MENLFIPATPSSPEVDFRFDEHLLSLKGESYPENAAAFYGHVISALRQYLHQTEPPATITLNVALVYFNSSSTKMLFALFGALDEKAKTGTNIILNWHHDVEDDTIFEFGQELRDDFSNLQFHDQAHQH